MGVSHLTETSDQSQEMTCNLDGHALEPSKTSGEPSMRCSECKGAWLTTAALETIEDKSFSADMVKGQRRYGEHDVPDQCPHCGDEMTRFRYRGYNLYVEACPNGAGYWLDHGEDGEIQDVMKNRIRNLERSQSAQRLWHRAVRGRGRKSFFERVKDVFRG